MIGWTVGGVAFVFAILLVARLLQRRVVATQDRELGEAPRHERSHVRSMRVTSRAE
jgi:hypothetical protein